MSARDWVEVVLAALLVVNLLVLGSSVAFALRRVGELSSRLRRTAETLEREAEATLQSARQTLGQTTQLTEAVTTLVRSQIAPTTEVAHAALEHIEKTLKGVADATAAVRRLAAGAEALTAPSAISAAMDRTLASRVGKVALLVAGVVALTRGVLHKPRGDSPRTT